MLSSRLTGPALMLATMTFWFLLIVSMAGCGTTSAERIATAQDVRDGYVALADDFDGQIDLLQQEVAAAEAALATATGDTAASIREALATAQEKLAELKAGKEQADGLVQAASAELDRLAALPTPTVSDELRALGAGVSGASPALGPYGWVATAIGSALSIAAGVFGFRERKRATTQASALGEVVRGAASAIKRVPTHENEIKRELKSHQSAATRALVDQLRPAA
ncbi:MAG: hypothetical protein AAGG38_09205 [Planctomycetota bacterium]